MKNSFLFGIIFLLIGGILFYVQRDDATDIDFITNFLPGILLGTGFGLILGAILGYKSKSKKLSTTTEKEKTTTLEEVKK